MTKMIKFASYKKKVEIYCRKDVRMLWHSSLQDLGEDK